VRDEIEVIQDIGVLGVTEDGDDLHVDIFGGETNVCGVVRFTFADQAERAAMRRLLDRWRKHGTALTFVSTGSTISLLNDRALFDRLSETSSAA
jgi:hypothetical protein